MAIIDKIEINQDWTEDGYKFEKGLEDKPKGFDGNLDRAWMETMLSDWAAAKPENVLVYDNGLDPDGPQLGNPDAKPMKDLRNLGVVKAGLLLLDVDGNEQPFPRAEITPDLSYAMRIERRGGMTVTVRNSGNNDGPHLVTSWEEK